MKIGVAEMPIAIIALVRLGPRNAASAIARIRNGRREHRVGHARDQRVGPAADVAGEQADRHAERERDRHRDDAGQQRRARAVDHARQHVAADLVGAEPVRGRRRLADRATSSSPADRRARATARRARSRRRTRRRRPGRPSRARRCDEPARARAARARLRRQHVDRERRHVIRRAAQGLPAPRAASAASVGHQPRSLGLTGSTRCRRAGSARCTRSP